MAFRTSLIADFTNITIRETFSPPAVDPAQEPINISIKSIVLEKGCHKSKSTVAYPVVVIIDETVKNK